MAHMVKAQPGCAPRLDGEGGQYEWTEAGQAIEVDPVTAEAIRRIDGFTEIAPPARRDIPAGGRRRKTSVEE